MKFSYRVANRPIIFRWQNNEAWTAESVPVP